MCPRALPNHHLLSLQPVLERKSLGRKQTLTYLRGYQREDPDPSGLMSRETPDRQGGSVCGGLTISSEPAQGWVSPTATGSASPATRTLSGTGSPLPKWVEQNGKVRALPAW